jgi:hypothetical protein
VIGVVEVFVLPDDFREVVRVVEEVLLVEEKIAFADIPGVAFGYLAECVTDLLLRCRG